MTDRGWVVHSKGESPREAETKERGGQNPADPNAARVPTEDAVPGATENAAGIPAEGTVQGPMQLRNTEVNLNGLMTVLGKHLYSTPVVAVRELVQNAHDSIIRRRLEDPAFAAAATTGAPADADASEKTAPQSRITVIGNPAKGTLRVIDTGAGLTAEEIHAYLATVGVGYTRTLREKDDDTGLIGMFGLGFLSAFVLANEVTVTTTSYQQPHQGRRYQSATGERYTLSPAPARAIGAEVALTLREEFTHLASPETLRRVLTHYCVLLREPVYVGDSPTPLNPERPPWQEPEGNTVEHPAWLLRKRLAFARRFEDYFEPVCTMPVTPPSFLTSEESDATACSGCRTARLTAPATTAGFSFSGAACFWMTTPATFCLPGPGSSAALSSPPASRPRPAGKICKKTINTMPPGTASPKP